MSACVNRITCTSCSRSWALRLAPTAKKEIKQSKASSILKHELSRQGLPHSQTHTLVEQLKANLGQIVKEKLLVSFKPRFVQNQLQMTQTLGILRANRASLAQRALLGPILGTYLALANFLLHMPQ